jgi:hypothetical protein
MPEERETISNTILHLPQHQKRIRETEYFWLKDVRTLVKVYDGVPGWD